MPTRQNQPSIRLPYRPRPIPELSGDEWKQIPIPSGLRFFHCECWVRTPSVCAAYVEAHAGRRLKSDPCLADRSGGPKRRCPRWEKFLAQCVCGAVFADDQSPGLDCVRCRRRKIGGIPLSQLPFILNGGHHRWLRTTPVDREDPEPLPDSPDIRDLTAPEKWLPKNWLTRSGRPRKGYKKFIRDKIFSWSLSTEILADIQRRVEGTPGHSLYLEVPALGNVKKTCAVIEDLLNQRQKVLRLDPRYTSDFGISDKAKLHKGRPNDFAVWAKRLAIWDLCKEIGGRDFLLIGRKLLTKDEAYLSCSDKNYSNHARGLHTQAEGMISSVEKGLWPPR